MTQTDRENWEERWEKFISILIVAIDTDFVGTMLTFYEHDLKAFIRTELSAARAEEHTKNWQHTTEISSFAIEQERERIRKLLEGIKKGLLTKNENKFCNPYCHDAGQEQVINQAIKLLE